MVKEAIKKVDVLIEALPYIKQFHKKVFVIKYGGSILTEEKVRKSVLEDIAFLRYTGIRPILVHGGGPRITERLKQMKVQSEFIDGVRVTDAVTLKVVDEELHILNDMIVEEINAHGTLARSIKEKDKILKVRKKKAKKDLGFVGELIDIDRSLIEEILPHSVPVITPMGVCSEGNIYNINADDVACFIAEKFNAEKLVFLTNVLGVMRNPQDKESLFSTLTTKDVQELIEDKIIEKGMIPKVQAAVVAIKAGVKKAHIVDAKIPHAVLLEIFTNQGVGTEIIL